MIAKTAYIYEHMIADNAKNLLFEVMLSCKNTKNKIMKGLNVIQLKTGFNQLHIKLHGIKFPVFKCSFLSHM